MRKSAICSWPIQPVCACIGLASLRFTCACARALRPCQLVFHILLRKCQIASTVFPLYISLIPVKKMPIVKKTVIFFILQVFSLLLCVFLFKKYNMKLKFNSGYWKIAGLRPAIFSGTPRNWGNHISGYWKIAGLRPAIFRGTPGNWEHPQCKLLENSRPMACYFQWNSWKLLSLCNNQFLFNSGCCYFQSNSQEILPFPTSAKSKGRMEFLLFNILLLDYRS